MTLIAICVSLSFFFWGGGGGGGGGAQNIVTPWVQKHFDKVRWQSPALTDSCMYTCTPDSDYIIDHLPNNQDIIIGMD